MLEALSSAFTSPSDGVAMMVLLAPVVVLVTTGFMAAVGRRVMRHSAIIAVLMGCAFLPLLMIALALLAAQSYSSGFGAAGILVAACLLSICALPVTLATSVLYVVIRQKKLAD